MKKIITLSAIILVVVACNNSNERKAKKLIKEYLKTTMNDFSSYEPVEFSELDSSFSNYYESEEGKKLNERMENKMEYIKDTRERVDRFIQQGYSKELIETFQGFYDESQREFDSLFHADIQARQSFIPEFDGWLMSHKFRGKNAFGGVILNEYIFHLDKDLTKVTDFTDYNVALDKLKEILDDE